MDKTVDTKPDKAILPACVKGTDMTNDETYAHFSILRDLLYEVKRNTEELVRRDVEMERLRAEIEALKKGQTR